jgi:hypothetical protein
MIRFFKTLQPATLILVPVIILAFWIRMVFQASPVSDSRALPLWDVVTSLLAAFPSWLNFILLFTVISIEAIYLNIIMNRHEVLYKNTFLPALIFALIISSTPLLMQFHPVHIVNILILFILNRTFTLFKTDFPISALFDCAFLSGIAALVYFPAVILFPFLFIALIILRPFSFKEWIITLIGIVLPYFFISVFLFWNHALPAFWKSYSGMFANIHPEILVKPGLNILILAFYFVSLLIYSLVKLRMNYRKNIIRTRGNQQIIFVLLLLGSVWLMLTEKIEVIHFAILVIPLTVFSSYLFVSAKKRAMIFEYVLWGLIAIIIWNQF